MHNSPSLRRTRAFALMGSAVIAAAAVGLPTTVAAQDEEVTINVALAANPQMKTAESLIADFEAKNPGVKVTFTTLPENELRPTVTKDVATGGGQFDVVMMGSYEVPIWAERGWLIPLQDYADASPEWDQEDLLTPIKNIVSTDGVLQAAPFYGSSSFLMYRKDLAEAAGVTNPDNPTWAEVATAAAAMDDPENDISGICLRGLPGWGQNLAPITTVINTFGGSWFDMDWNPQLTSDASKEAVNFYVDLLKEYGQPDAAKDGWEGCLQRMSQGKTAMWYDDTVFAGSVIGQAATPEIADNIAFAMAPTGAAGLPSGWLWSWGLGIVPSSQHPGWQDIPPGSRYSTYEIPEYLDAASRYADLTLKSIDAANPLQTTVMPVPYTGVQYVQIPEFVDIGDFVSQQIAGALAGDMTTDEALQKSQDYTAQVMQQAGYTQ